MWKPDTGLSRWAAPLYRSQINSRKIRSCISSVSYTHLVCIGYMLCKKYGVDTQNFAIDRIPDELKNKEPKDIKAELGKTQKAFKEITARVSDELYRQRADRSKEQER